MKVQIVEVDATLEAIALRSAAECWDMDVSVVWVGNAAQVVAALSQSTPFDLVIICAHGDERGLLLPDLAEDLKPNYPFADVISAADFSSFVKIEKSVVLNTSCAMGTPEFAKAFLGNGASAYIAAPDYPDADIALLYALTFLYHFGLNCGEPGHAHAAADTAIEVKRNSENRFELFT